MSNKATHAPIRFWVWQLPSVYNSMVVLLSISLNIFKTDLEKLKVKISD
jgi:hypothetical protein